MASSDFVKVDRRCSICSAPVGVLVFTKGDWICISCGLKVEPPMLWLSSILRQLSDSAREVS